MRGPICKATEHLEESWQIWLSQEFVVVKEMNTSTEWIFNVGDDGEAFELVEINGYSIEIRKQDGNASLRGGIDYDEAFGYQGPLTSEYAGGKRGQVNLVGFRGTI